MPRRLRCADGGYVYHVLNRAVGRATLFQKSGDYAAFEKIIRHAWNRSAMPRRASAAMTKQWHRVQETGVPWLRPWPVAAPEDWTAYVNRPETDGELVALRRSVVRGAPLGDAAWQQRTAQRLGLESALRNRGRQRKQESDK